MIIVQNVESAQRTGQITMKIKGEKIRVDVSPEMSTISDSSTGDVVSLMHNEKRYVLIPASNTRELYRQLQQMSDGKLSKPKLKDTGQNEEIGGHTCRIYTATAGAIRLRYWIADAYPNASEILSQMDRAAGKFGDLMGSVLPKASDFPGLPLKTVMENAGQKITTTLVSVQAEELPASIVQVPADYHTTVSPKFQATVPTR